MHSITQYQTLVITKGAATMNSSAQLQAARKGCAITSIRRTHTSNMRKHAKLCWGEESVNMANEAKNANEAHTIISAAKNGSIVASFERKGKGKVIYSHRQHTKTETKYVPLQ
jgi:hypothetical protein